MSVCILAVLAPGVEPRERGYMGNLKTGKVESAQPLDPADLMYCSFSVLNMTNMGANLIK